MSKYDNYIIEYGNIVVKLYILYEIMEPQEVYHLAYRVARLHNKLLNDKTITSQFSHEYQYLYQHSPAVANAITSYQNRDKRHHFDAPMSERMRAFRILKMLLFLSSVFDAEFIIPEHV